MAAAKTTPAQLMLQAAVGVAGAAAVAWGQRAWLAEQLGLAGEPAPGGSPADGGGAAEARELEAALRAEPTAGQVWGLRPKGPGAGGG